MALSFLLLGLCWAMAAIHDQPAILAAIGWRMSTSSPDSVVFGGPMIGPMSPASCDRRAERGEDDRSGCPGVAVWPRGDG